MAMIGSDLKIPCFTLPAESNRVEVLNRILYSVLRSNACIGVQNTLLFSLGIEQTDVHSVSYTCLKTVPRGKRPADTRRPMVIDHSVCTINTREYIIHRIRRSARGCAAENYICLAVRHRITRTKLLFLLLVRRFGYSNPTPVVVVNSCNHCWKSRRVNDYIPSTASKYLCSFLQNTGNSFWTRFVCTI